MITKYEFMLRSRFDPRVTVQEKHDKFTEALHALAGSWTVDLSKLGALQAAPPCYGCALSRALPKGISGRANYLSAAGDDDESSEDNYISLQTNDDATRYYELHNHIAPSFVFAFSAYYLEFTAAETYLNKPFFNVRHQVGGLGLVNFFDKLLCERAFGMTPAAVVKAVKKDVAEAKTLHNGVYVVLSKDILGPKEIQEQGKLVRSLLPNSPFKK